MSGVSLKPEDRAYFLQMMRRRLNSAVHRRMNVLLLLDDGWGARRIAEAFYIDEGTDDGTVAEHRQRHREDGRAGIERLDYRGRSSLPSEAQGALAAHVDARVPLTSKEVWAWVEQAFGLACTPNAMTKLLKRLGFVHKKPKCVPARADAAAQRRFVAETLMALMQAAGEASPLYFADATHPAYSGRPAHGWMRKGAARELRSNHGRTRLNINGALCWHELSMVHRRGDKITSQAMIALFEDVQARHPTATAIAVVIDNAKYNVSREMSREIRAWFARAGRRVKPVHLPSHAPNLDLIERFWRFWRFMKTKVPHNRYYPKFADFRAALEDFFAHVGGWKDELERLLTPRFHFIGTPENGIS